MPVQTEAYVMLSMVLFVLGALGVLLKRNAILVFMSVELMLNATNWRWRLFARHWGRWMDLCLFVITVAAAEVAVGLALIVIFRTKRSINIDELHQMEG
jgi:NADH-quinone oxidoreductase subunit K